MKTKYKIILIAVILISGFILIHIVMHPTLQAWYSQYADFEYYGP